MIEAANILSKLNPTYSCMRPPLRKVTLRGY